MNIRLRQYVIFITSGLIWYFIYQLIVFIVDRRSLSFHYQLELLILSSSIITSTIVGTLFLKPIINFKSSKWYWLPLFTLSFSTTLFGFFIWLILYYFIGRTNEHGVFTNNFLDIPITYLFYSLTYFIWLLYPLALLTQYLIRFFLLQKPSKARLE